MATKWAGWVAAVGGAIALISQYVASINAWGVPLGAIVAIVFGVWASLAK